MPTTRSKTPRRSRGRRGVAVAQQLPALHEAFRILVRGLRHPPAVAAWVLLWCWLPPGECADPVDLLTEDGHLLRTEGSCDLQVPVVLPLATLGRGQLEQGPLLGRRSSADGCFLGSATRTSSTPFARAGHHRAQGHRWGTGGAQVGRRGTTGDILVSCTVGFAIAGGLSTREQGLAPADAGAVEPTLARAVKPSRLERTLAHAHRDDARPTVRPGGRLGFAQGILEFPMPEMGPASSLRSARRERRPGPDLRALCGFPLSFPILGVRPH